MVRVEALWWQQVKTVVKRHRHWFGVEAAVVLGLILAAAGVAKLLHQPEAYEVFFIPFPALISRVFTKFYFIWLPRIELALGLLLIFGIAARFISVLALTLITGFIISNSVMIIHNLSLCLSCFGPRVQLPTVSALVIDLIMVALVVIILLCYRRSFFDIYPWKRTFLGWKIYGGLNLSNRKRFRSKDTSQ